MTQVRLTLLHPVQSYEYSYFRIIDDNLTYKIRTIEFPQVVSFILTSKEIFYKYNKIQEEDMDYIIEQFYCEWRFLK